MKNKQKGSDFIIGNNSQNRSNEHIISLPCEAIANGSGEIMVKQFFGNVCQKLSNHYGPKCHKICRMFKQDYNRLHNSFNAIASEAIKEMDEHLVLLEDHQEAAIIFNARNQAQILEIDSQYNAHWTRKNLGLGKHHKLRSEELAINFFKHEAPIDFPIRWKKMLEEIRYKSDNAHYAKEKFETDHPSLKELFWTYRFGRAIEFFGINHQNLFRAGHLVSE
jgi:hypothetical protein